MHHFLMAAKDCLFTMAYWRKDQGFRRNGIMELTVVRSTNQRETRLD